MNPFQSLRDYENFVYTLPERHASVLRSTLTVVRDATLASTHPHHKHIPPDIKHHRVPAPGLSFERPNLLFLIEEIEEVVLGRGDG